MNHRRIASLTAASVCLIAFSLGTGPRASAEPRGVISASVQNQTTQGILKESNVKSDAVRVRAGDTLRYVVTLRNTATDSNKDAMYTAKLTGSLPDGVELASDPSKRVIDTDLDVIPAAGQVVKEYQVKVTASKDGDYIEFKPCFSGDNAARDNPVKGCDSAFVKVDKTRPDAPAAPAPAAPATTIPNTGASTLFAPVTAFLAGAAAYAARLRSFKRADRRSDAEYFTPPAGTISGSNRPTAGG